MSELKTHPNGNKEVTPPQTEQPPSAIVRVFSDRRIIIFCLLFVAASFAGMIVLGRAVESAPPLQTSPKDGNLFKESEAPEMRPASDPNAPESEEQMPTTKYRIADVSRELLDSKGWSKRVGDGLGVWVSIREQMFRILLDSEIVMEARCSTSAKGPGSKVNSLRTPIGWHHIEEKFGENAPFGQVFREKHLSKDVWKPGDVVKEDLVLTRVLTLTGEEPGRNKGGDVDSFDRGIYIHGTNDEDKIGTPASHGCIRLSNTDVITAFPLIPLETPLLITEE
jgi:hypothetical protein